MDDDVQKAAPDETEQSREERQEPGGDVFRGPDQSAQRTGSLPSEDSDETPSLPPGPRR